MASSRGVMLGTASLLALLFCLGLGTIGQEKQQKIPIEGFPCGTKPLKADKKVGMNPPLIYICKDDVVNLDPNGHTFTMTFKTGECPFSEGCDDLGKPITALKTKTCKGWDGLTLVKYTVTVDGGDPIDPIIIGGGGHGYEDSKSKSRK